MPHNQVLLIHPETPVQTETAARLAQAGYCVAFAAGRKEALQQMYQVHPDLILIEFVASAETGWEILSRIRLFTDTCAILKLSLILPSDLQRAAALGNAELIQDSTHSDEWMALITRHLAGRPRSHKRSKVTRSTHTPLRFMSMAELVQIDRALEQVGEAGEVHLVKERGRLRFICKVKTQPYQPL